MKSYLDYKDIKRALGVGKNKAYKILDELREMKVEGIAYKNTYESTSKNKKDIPTKLFLKKYPHCRNQFKK